MPALVLLGSCWAAAALIPAPRLPRALELKRAPVPTLNLRGGALSPGYNAAKLDQLISTFTSTKVTTTIIRPYDADRQWLWRQWSGTTLQLTWRSCVLAALLASVNCVAARQFDWHLANVADSSLSTMWGYQLSLATIVSSFFLNQAWSFRGSVYDETRKVQGRCQDLVLLATLHAKRCTAPPTHLAATRASFGATYLCSPLPDHWAAPPTPLKRAH